jgi:hypothetical protein
MQARRLSKILSRGEPVPAPPEPAFPDASPEDRVIVERATPFTMTGPDRLHALVDAVRYCVAAGIPGDFAECGVWRGGSVLAMILTLQSAGIDDRDIHLFDTFEGMTEPTEQDVSAHDRPALETWQEAQASGTRAWDAVFGESAYGEDMVRQTLLETGYPADRLHLVRGPVEETLPDAAPERIALARLDTDWYESTHHEMLHLYPRIESGGVLIIDDYGHWQGARRAVDEYLEEMGVALLLNRVDYAARIALKP